MRRQLQYLCYIISTVCLCFACVILLISVECRLQLSMEDLYEILECSAEASDQQIKQKFKELARRYHPDHHVGGDTLTHQKIFVKINNAYGILKDPKLKKEYDIRYQHLQTYQELPVQDTVYFDDLDCDNSDAETQLYTYPCRCGDEYVLSEIDIQLKYQYAACLSCSLCIKILYSDENSLDNQPSICDSYKLSVNTT